ncbi:hypothetical protein ACEN8I_00360 [Polaromonas sp. CT11-55]|uniref:hypothetical protein n=1 Tax=Polaromonas sp. CT11-55 TaxID=3243045 RepID=UPI0039A5DFBC
MYAETHDAGPAMPCNITISVDAQAAGRLSAFSYVFRVLITAACHISMLKLASLRTPDMKAHAAAETTPDTGRRALALVLDSCVPRRPFQQPSAHALKVTFAPLDIFLRRSKLRMQGHVRPVRIFLRIPVS